MSDITVKFLGDEYTFPEELQEYVLYCNEFEKINDRLQKRLLQTMKLKNLMDPEPSQVGEIERTLKDFMREEGKKVIPMLAEKGIYDVTESDLVDNNKGYKYYDDVYHNMMGELGANLTEEMQNYMNQSEQAQAAAYSQVTGSGVGVLTNSLWGIMTYTALEGSVVKKQVEQAENDYQSALQVIAAKGSSKREKKDAEVMVKTYPELAKAFNMFAADLLEIFLSTLQREGVFDYSKTKSYDLDRSSELLKNIDLVSDKASVLKAAFKTCPYNPEIYSRVIALGLADAETIKTAQYYHQGYLFDQEVTDVVDKYTEAKDILSKDKFLIEWIKVHISRSYSIMSSTSSEDVSNQVVEYVDSFTSEKEFNAWIQSGLLKPEDIRLRGSTKTDLSSINSEVEEALTERVVAYIGSEDAREYFGQIEKETKKREREKEEAEKQVQKNKEDAVVAEESKRQRQSKMLRNVGIAAIACLLVVGIVVIGVRMYRDSVFNKQVESDTQVFNLVESNLDEGFSNGQFQCSQEMANLLGHETILFGDVVGSFTAEPNISDRNDLWTILFEAGDVSTDQMEEAIKEMIAIYGEHYTYKTSYPSTRIYKWEQQSYREIYLEIHINDGKLFIGWWP